MDQSCTVSDENGNVQENGFTRLDLAKHSMKPVVYTMRPQDRLAVIIYDDQVDVLFDLKQMTKDN